jgi:hypothetical protein
MKVTEKRIRDRKDKAKGERRKMSEEEQKERYKKGM